jgi:hypothetical protein
MKRLLVLIITSVFINGCNVDESHPINKYRSLIVKSFENYNDVVIYKASYSNLDYNTIYFLDTIGAYKVGDTITIKKR